MKGKYFKFIVLFTFLSISLSTLLFAAAKDVTAKTNEKENAATDVDCPGNAEKDLAAKSGTAAGSDTSSTSKSDEKLVVAQSPCGGMGAGAMTGGQTGTGAMSGMGMGMTGTGTGTGTMGTMSGMGMGMTGTGTGTGAMSGMGMGNMGMGTGTGTGTGASQ